MRSQPIRFERGDLIYENALAQPDDLDRFIMEGDGTVSFPLGRMRMEGTRDPSEGQKANIVHWCPQALPDDVAITWDFYPIREPGLCILFFAATGREGQDIHDPALAKRTGPYGQYHHGDINALHVSYFRRKHVTERAFTTCNLRKSHGFHLVAQGADPIPSIPDVMSPYQIELIKAGPYVRFSIAMAALPDERVTAFEWTDDGRTYGPVLGGGKIGFRQMTPMIAEYANLKVHAVRAIDN